MGRIEVELPDTVDVSKYSHGEIRLPMADEIILNFDGSTHRTSTDYKAVKHIVLIPKEPTNGTH